MSAVNPTCWNVWHIYNFYFLPWLKLVTRKNWLFYWLLYRADTRRPTDQLITKRHAIHPCRKRCCSFPNLKINYPLTCAGVSDCSSWVIISSSITNGMRVYLMKTLHVRAPPLNNFMFSLCNDLSFKSRLALYY